MNYKKEEPRLSEEDLDEMLERDYDKKEDPEDIDRSRPTPLIQKLKITSWILATLLSLNILVTSFLFIDGFSEDDLTMDVDIYPSGYGYTYILEGNIYNEGREKKDCEIKLYREDSSSSFHSIDLTVDGDDTYHLHAKIDLRAKFSMNYDFDTFRIELHHGGDVVHKAYFTKE
jgi:hypothetical protein